MERQLAAHQEAEPLKRHSFAAEEPPVFDRHSQQNVGGNMAAQHSAKGAAAAQHVANTGAALAANPATPVHLSEGSCVKENLDEENRLSYTSPGKIAARTSPPPTAISFFNYGNDQPTPKPDHVKYLSSLRPRLARNRVPVCVVGRASCPGKAARNLELSQNRAEIVADLLKPSVRVEVKWVGESEPVADNSTVEGRSRNRAVDIIPLPPPIPPISICKIFPALCQVPPPPPPPPRNFCELNPELCKVPNFCQLFPLLCQEGCKGDDCDDDHDHRTFCLDHPVICACALAPEICLACIEDPALCIGALECILNPAACISPPRPPKPPKPPVPVTVQFTPVRALNTPAGAHDRIPDTGTTAVAAIVTGWKPPMPPLRISADGAGGVNGDVLINGANELFITTSAIIQVQGVSQTSPDAPELPLSLHATMGLAPVGQSAPFAVADFMENISINLQHVVLTDPSLLDQLTGGLMGVNVFKNDNRIGMGVSMSWDSDGGQGKKSLDEVSFDWAHQVLASTGKWTSKPLDGALGKGDKGYIFESLEDMPMNDLGRRETQLVWFLSDRRSHSVAAITNSGFKLEEVVEPDPHRKGCLQLSMSMTGNAGDVQGFRSNAGSGTAEATIPIDCPLECGSKRLPRTEVFFSPGPQGQGERVKASPLTMCEGNTHGSEPDQSIYEQQFECIRQARRTQQVGMWVRAHLLHGETSRSGPRNLHGPGDDMRNLIITDGGFGSLNTDMYFGAEEPALDRVFGPRNEVLWYESRVNSYVPGLNFFAQSLTVDFGSFDTDTRTDGPRLGGGIFTLRKTSPNCP